MARRRVEDDLADELVVVAGADPADLEDALDGADAPMVKFNDPASGASTAATGNDYELICEIKVAPASSPSP